MIITEEREIKFVATCQSSVSNSRLDYTDSWKVIIAADFNRHRYLGFILCESPYTCFKVIENKTVFKAFLVEVK
jgi:hypothetical protein